MASWLGLTTEQLNSLYDARGAAGDWPALYGDMQKRSAEFYQTAKLVKNIPYASAARTNFDFIDSGAENAPTLLFIHGGAWQACAKEDFAFIADGITKAGINVLLAEHTLAPDASLTQIVRETGQFLDFVQAHADTYKLRKGKVVLGGHSSGGHLACVHRGHPVASHVFSVSPLTELVPISLCSMNDKLSLTAEEIERFSPIRHLQDGVPTSVHNGANESIESIRQALAYAEALLTTKSKSVYAQTPDCEHFRQLYQFSNPDGFLLKALLRLLKE